MAVTNIEHALIHSAIFMEGHRLHAEVRTLTGATDLAADCAPVQYLDPGGATRTVDLPAMENGTVLIIINTADAAEDLTVRNESDATVGTVSGSAGGTTNEVGYFHRVAGAWRVMHTFARVAN